MFFVLGRSRIRATKTFSNNTPTHGKDGEDAVLLNRNDRESASLLKDVTYKLDDVIPDNTNVKKNLHLPPQHNNKSENPNHSTDSQQASRDSADSELISISKAPTKAHKNICESFKYSIQYNESTNISTSGQIQSVNIRDNRQTDPTLKKESSSTSQNVLLNQETHIDNRYSSDKTEDVNDLLKNICDSSRDKRSPEVYASSSKDQPKKEKRKEQEDRQETKEESLASQSSSNSERDANKLCENNELRRFDILSRNPAPHFETSLDSKFRFLIKYHI